MNENQVAKHLTKELICLGFVVHRYNAVTTDSIYLKLDYGVCCGIEVTHESWTSVYAVLG